MMRCVVAILIAFTFCPTLAAQPSNIDSPGPHASAARVPSLRGARSFGGIDVARADRFWERWHLVTVRFRKDNGEQRFVYANDIAWKAMQARLPAYPDGSMFGKVAFLVEDDTSFPNSQEPRRFTRIQLMKKDKALYRETDGWSYALVAAGAGLPAAADEKRVVTACHACHRVVPERDFVFAQPTFPDAPRATTHAIAFKERFVELPTKDLSRFQRNALMRVLHPDSVASIRSVKALSMELFPGSVHESVGVLARYATDDGRIYALWDETNRRFLISRPLEPTSACKTRSVFALTLQAHTTTRAESAAPAFQVGRTCNGVWQGAKSTR